MAEIKTRKAQRLYSEAKQIILGGNMLLSKDQKCFYRIYGHHIFLNQIRSL